MPTSLAQKEANRRWRLRNKEYFKMYHEKHEDSRPKEYFREYYHKNKQHIKFRNECARLRKILLDL